MINPLDRQVHLSSYESNPFQIGQMTEDDANISERRTQSDRFNRRTSKIQ
jgi:hypothetical protein